MYEYFIESTTLAISVSLMIACFMMLGLHPRRLPFNATLYFLMSCVFVMLVRYVRIAWSDVDWTKVFSIAWLVVLITSINLNIGIWKSAKEDSIYDRKRLFNVNQPRGDGPVLVYPPFGDSDRDIRPQFSGESERENKFEALSRLLDAIHIGDHDGESVPNKTNNRAALVDDSSGHEHNNSGSSNPALLMESGDSGRTGDKESSLSSG